GAVARAPARGRGGERLTAPRERPVEWAALTTTHGEVLDAFASYCRDELDDAPPAGREEPTLLVTALTDELVSTLLDDASLRARVAVYDLARLEKVNAVRSSVFVHFEWFLRDAYGVKLVASDAFTRGLVDRGIISLGFG